jgi:hypothetical protein
MLVTNFTYQTNPIVLHNPLSDRVNHEWQYCVRNTLHKPIKQQNCPEIDICTWNSSFNPGLLEINLKKNGLNYTCLGRGIKNWSNRLKIKLALEFVNFTDKKYVFAADCFDVLLVGEISDLLKRFHATGAQVIFNATGTNYPPCDRNGRIEERICKDRPFCYLNSGMFIGRTDYLRGLLEEVEHYEDEYTMLYSTSDQIKYKPIYHRRFPDVQLDSQCQMFQVMFLQNGDLSKHIGVDRGLKLL